MGKNIYDAFKTSEEAEQNGQWFNYGPGPSEKDQRFLLARMSRSNKKYTAAVQRMHDEYGRQAESGTMEDATARRVLRHIFCTTVLLAWEGIHGPDRVEIPWSSEAAEEYLEELPALQEELEEIARDREHFLQKQKEADSGN